MSFHSWLQNLRSALAPRRRQRHHARRGSLRAATHRLNLEPLEDRRLLAFSPAVSYPAGSYPYAIVSADFNGGGADIAVANLFSDTVSVLLGDGLGGFGVKNDFATGASPRSLVVGDVSGDGKLDLITANAADISILRGDGLGNFALPDSIAMPGQFPYSYVGAYPVAQSPQSAATGDFNADGRLDLVVTGVTSFLRSYTGYYGDIGYTQVDNQYVNVLISDGSGGFNPAVTIPMGQVTYPGGTHELVPFYVAVGRFNADAKDDLAIASYGTVSIYLSDGVGGFLSSGSFAAGYYRNYSYSVTAGDVNGDLKTDLVTANAADVSVLLGDGLGGFGGPQNFAAGTSVVLGDFNNDTRLDIATANYSSVSVLRGNGNGTFSPAENFAAGPAYAVAAGDFNGDGWLDVATANANGSGASVLINDKSWPFIPPSVTINDATVTEGNTGTASATFTLTLSHVSTVDVTVHYATANITAAAGSDYTAASADVTIPAGQLSRTLTVAVKGDRLAEPTETFAVNLSAATNATIGDGQSIGTILDNEPRISISDFSKAEGKKGQTTLFTFTVTLSAAYDQPVTMSYRTLNGTAKTSDGDYIAKAGTLTFAPGETVKTITIEVKGDSKKESNEVFYLDLYGLGSNALFTKNRGIGTILNDD